MRRKILTIIIIICMVIPYAPTASADDPAAMYVRVKLSMGTPSSVPVCLDGNYSAEGGDGAALQRGNYTVKLEGGGIALYSGSSKIFSGASLKLVQHAATPGLNNVIRLNNAKYGNTDYLGDMEFLPYSGNSYIVVINRVYIEDYLYGVLPYEMSDSWPVEALKTQAVCARNYVEKHMGGSGLYDVVDTSANQVYRGFKASNTNSIQAVNATAGTVITSNGKLADVYFSASNGGYTEIPQHVWSASATLAPYHVIQEDPYDAANPYSSQEELIFPKAISGEAQIAYMHSSGGKMVAGTGNESSNAKKYLLISALPEVSAKGYIANVTTDIDILGINSIIPNTYDDQHDIKDYNGNDACVSYQKATVNMTVLAKRFVPEAVPGDVNNDRAITISDYTLVRLGMLGLRPLSDGEKASADVNNDGDVSISDYTLMRLDILGIKKISNSAVSGVYVEEPVTVEFNIDLHQLDDSGGLYQAFDNTSLRLFVITQTDTGWNIYHRRYGHGVGMSQRGAQQRANSSDPDVNTYDKILAFYYPNTQLTVQGYTRPVLAPLQTDIPSPSASPS